MKFYYFVLIVVHGQIILSEIPLCVRKGIKVCCSGYIWNETTRICDECPPGYSGTDCEFMCYPPYYGARCLQTCQCPRDLCDAVSGCKTTSTTGMSGNNAKTVTTRYRQKDFNGDILYEGTPALPKCIGGNENKLFCLD
uniref:Multiple epidermal growth factor-like domains protein 10 n=1 Tax=Crassostrea virginica TaxID=6565 RepID=A0A8B8AVS9_CRAVI|nr:multiple epidermal growth factor-like domains protein 10 [Crassostrea virginica]